MIAEKFVVQIPAESYISLTSSFDFWFDEMEEAEQLTFFSSSWCLYETKPITLKSQIGFNEIDAPNQNKFDYRILPI